jgi:DNA (cytosine-5)-methyltransferase 1
VTKNLDATRAPALRAFFNGKKVDLFAGGGGAGLGGSWARGDEGADIAANHSPVAIAMYRANFPKTQCYIEDVYKVDPRKVVPKGEKVSTIWLSPDCTHHSKARGKGKPRDQKIRGLAWSVVPWIKHCRPDLILLENVEEFVDWGPLHKIHSGGCTGEDECTKNCHFQLPIKSRKGETFRAFVKKLEKYGYIVAWTILKACDYGAPTSRKRLFLQARRDGLPISWPVPTHGPGRQQPYRTAAEIIDWSIPCPSIFGRKKPLKFKTEARLARGVVEFVLKTHKPFIIPTNHGGVGRRDHRVHAIDNPMPTITGGRRGEHAVAVPYLVRRSNGERVGQAPRIENIEQPLTTIVAQGQKQALCTAFLAKHYSDRPTGGWAGGQAADKPIGTVTAQDHHSVVAADLIRYNGDRPGAERIANVNTPLGIQDTSNRYGLVLSNLVKFRGTSDAHIAASAHSVEEPLATISAQGTHVAVSATFLVRYNGQSGPQPVDLPIGTLDARDRYATATAELATQSAEVDARAHEVYDLLVRHGYDGPALDHDSRLVWVTIGGEAYVISNVGMRMLVPPELFAAQSFPPEYVIAPIGPRGKPLTKTEQVRACGNSVPPKLAEAVVRAAEYRCDEYRQAA